MQDCGSCLLPLGVVVSDVIDVSAVINWGASSEETTAVIRFRQSGTTDWTELNNIAAPYSLTDLMACTNYEFQLRSDCGTETSGFSRIYTFKTDGCCTPPNNIRVTSSSNQSVRIEWDTLFAAEGYEFAFSEAGQSNMEITSTASNFMEFSNLNNCTDYNFQVRTICATMATDFSPLQLVTTNGCGSCTDVPYCESTADGDFEWISLVQLNTLNNETESENGYGDYTGLSTNLNTAEEYDITLNIGYSGFPFDENIQAWIDFNQDGIFDETTENIINLEEDILSEFSGKFTVPEDAVPGLTRLRIAIKWRGAVGDSSIPGPCDSYMFGEVEDYCVNIVQTVAQCFVPEGLSLIAAPAQNDVSIGWNAALGATDYQYRYRIQGTNDWMVATSNNATSIAMTNLESCTAYEIQTQSLCEGMMSDFSETFVFNTTCECDVPTNVRQEEMFDNAVRIVWDCLLYTSPSPRDATLSRMPSSA